MKYESATLVLALLGLTSAAPTRETRSLYIPRHILRGREVPQEHSHEKFLDSVRTSLNVNNPDGIVDPVFGLLGNGAAAGGLGKLTDTECLQQSTADQAFTNALAAKDITGMTNALAFRALERNTGGVGLKSNSCTSVTAVNPQIAAISQHQDPASSGAAAINKAIVLELAKQIASIGGNASVALDTGTFTPGTIGDPTEAGHTCDTQNDPIGCIFTENLIVLDATQAEIDAAVGGAGGASTPSTAAAAAVVVPTTTAAVAVACPADVTITMLMTVTAGSAAVATSAASAPATGTNIQTFTGTLGGAPPPVISSSGDRPFSVNGNTFVNAGAALQRSCSIQHNACADAANSGQLSGGVGQCDTQESACNAAAGAKKSKAKRAALDFGTCSDPSILFEFGLDGRTTDAFIAENQADFNHGSALNIGVISGFICQRLGSPCNAPADVQAACTSASSLAGAATGQAAADAFNSALGVAPTAAGATAAAPATTSGCAAASTVTVMMTTTVAPAQVAVQVTASAAATCAPAPTVTVTMPASTVTMMMTMAAAPTTAAAVPASGTNVQTFTGALGGIGAPAVIETSGDRPFSTDDATFVNAAAALQRSCSVQHNQCADAANAGTLAGGEQQCETQEAACNAANGV